MPEVKKVLKRRVVVLEEGKDIGRVDDIYLSPREHRVEVIVLHTDAVPELNVVCLAEAVQGFSSENLAIDKMSSVVLAKDSEAALELARAELRMRQRPVLTSQGEDLGRIHRVEVDEHGKVVRYGVSKGLLGWLGRVRWVEPAELNVGEEMAVVRPARRGKGSG